MTGRGTVWSNQTAAIRSGFSTRRNAHPQALSDQVPRKANGNLTSDGVRSYTYDQTNRLTQVTQGSQTTQFAYNGDGVRTSKTVAGDTTEYVLDLAATLPVVISDTEAVYLYGLDIIARKQEGCTNHGNEASRLGTC